MDSNRGVPDGTENESSSTPKTTAAAPVVSGTSEAQSNKTLNWKPNDVYLRSLVSMGISVIAAKKALYYTKNVSTEAAIEWIFENQEDLDTPLELELQLTSLDSDHHAPSISGTSVAVDGDGEEDELYKMVFVVNAELNMGTGKIASQVAHAALGIHRILLQHQEKYGESLLNWTEYGETKIVLRGDSSEQLVALEHKAIEDKLPCYLVHDAGKTQVRSGSTTVLAIFGSNTKVDKVTGKMKLY